MKKKSYIVRKKLCDIYKKEFSANNKNIKRLEIIVIALDKIEKLLKIFLS